ncbi:MAG: hypothetical protein UHJ11_00625 [Paludibacteraceae bacterium]|nr:hypothetical protein [Paludibacteraceae bacterium]
MNFTLLILQVEVPARPNPYKNKQVTPTLKYEYHPTKHHKGCFACGIIISKWAFTALLLWIG